MVITIFSFGIKSSMEMSYSSNPMDVLLSSPYLSLMTSISSRITPRSNFSSARIASSLSIWAISSAYSFSSFSLSNPVRARRRISTIAWAWTSSSSNFSMSSAFAACTVLEPRMIRITSSILSSAINNPFKICALSFALFSSYFVRRVTTSSWCFR